jgi:hypothetical protein
MDYEREVTLLSAETLAIQHILTNVLYELKSLNPGVAAAISRGFDNAARQVEDSAIQAGKSVPPEHLVKALRIVEDLRTATVGYSGKPTGIV